MPPMTASAALTSDAIARYIDEVLRWNTRFNLVSRQDTEPRLRALVRQSALGCERLWRTMLPRDAAAAAGARDLWYVDLGSGAGLPGFVWHLMLSTEGALAGSWLVEPRDKRAWFLARLPRTCGVAPYTVLQGRWGEIAPNPDADSDAPATPGVVVLTLKALHLDDTEVLAGLVHAAQEGFDVVPTAGGQVVVARYASPDQEIDEALSQRLGLAEPGRARSIGGLRYRAGEPEALSVGDASAPEARLIISRFEIL